ncbi:MAG: arginase family protein, partial [Candidatus Limnocylindrales bacterium]
MAKRHDPGPDGGGPAAGSAAGGSPAGGFAAANGWDRDYEVFSDFDLPTYVGPTTFMNLPWISDAAELRKRRPDVAIVGAPFDDGVSHRSGARFGPRSIRQAQYTSG